jgi:hypothetical protein
VSLCLCILLLLLANNSVKMFPWQWKIVEGIIFCEVCVVWNESRRLVLPRTCFVGYFLLSVSFLSPLCAVYAECWASQLQFSNIMLWIQNYVFYIQVSQEERSVFWEVIVSIILSKNVYVRVLFRTVSELELLLYRWATCHVLTRAAKCINVDRGIFENVLY